MSLDDESEVFLEWLANRLPSAAKVSYTFGASNGPLVLENGFRLGLFNIDRTDFDALADSESAFYLLTRILIPPRCALHVALIYHFARWLASLR